MSEPALRYAVLLERPERFDVQPLAQALARWRGVPAADAVMPARRCWGILVEDEPQARAEELAELLKAAKLPALAAPRSLLEEPPPLTAAPALELKAAARLILLAAAGFKVTTSKTIKSLEGPSTAQRAVKIGLMMAGVPVGMGGGQREVVKTFEESDLRFYVDLILKDPVQRLRVDAQAFDYSCLGARKTYGALVNFRTLLALLAEAAPAAPRNRGCRYLLEGRPVREMGYEGLEDLEREERWLLTLRALGKLP